MNHTKVFAIVTTKERESNASNIMRYAMDPKMAIQVYVAKQSPRTVWPRRNSDGNLCLGHTSPPAIAGEYGLRNLLVVANYNP